MREKLQAEINAFWVYMLGPHSGEPLKSLRPQSGWKSFLKRIANIYIFKWCLRGCLATIIAWIVYKFFNNPYSLDSIKEGLAPKLWNTAVMIGLILSVLSMIFRMISQYSPHARIKSAIDRFADYLGQSSSDLLIFASEVGAFSFGIVLALFILAFFNSNFDVTDVIFAFGGFFLMGLVLLLNFVVWWLAHSVLTKNEQPKLIQFWLGRSSGFKLVIACVGLIYFTAITLMSN